MQGAPESAVDTWIPTWLTSNRNLVLFIAVILLVLGLPAFNHSRSGEVSFAAVNMLIMGVAALSNGSSRTLYWTACAFAIPALVLSVLGIVMQKHWIAVPIWIFGATVNLLTIVRLLHEIFTAKTITRDRLFGCANVYLLIGVLWCYLYALLEHFTPNSMSGFGPSASLHAADTIYFSFNMVTSVGLTEVLPTSKAAKSLVLLEQLASVLYMAFVISRLVGLYAPPDDTKSDGDR